MRVFRGRVEMGWGGLGGVCLGEGLTVKDSNVMKTVLKVPTTIHAVS